MNHNVTQSEGNNEPVNFVLGNYFIELEPRNYLVKEASSTSDTQPDLLWFSQADEIDCKIVDLAVDVDVDSCIVVVDIPEAYGLVLSRDWSAKLNGYFASNWSHLWFPHKGNPNQIKVLREPHMKHNVIQLEGKNEPVNSMLGNYFIELEPRNYQAKEASGTPDT